MVEAVVVVSSIKFGNQNFDVNFFFFLRQSISVAGTLFARRKFNRTNDGGVSRSYSSASSAVIRRESHGWLLPFPMIEENSIFSCCF